MFQVPARSYTVTRISGCSHGDSSAKPRAVHRMNGPDVLSDNKARVSANLRQSHRLTAMPKCQSLSVLPVLLRKLDHRLQIFRIHLIQRRRRSQDISSIFPAASISSLHFFFTSSTVPTCRMETGIFPAIHTFSPRISFARAISHLIEPRDHLSLRQLRKVFQPGVVIPLEEDIRRVSLVRRAR